MVAKIHQISIIVGTFFLFVAADASAAEQYVLDPVHSTVVIGAKHAGASYTRGMFRKVSGGFSFDEKNPAKSNVSVEIEAGSIYTANKKRDNHLTSPDFLSAKQYPSIQFHSTKIAKKGNAYLVTGNLTLHGVTKTVMVSMEHVGAGKGPYGKFRRGFEGTFTVKRSEYGMTKMMGPVSDEIQLIVSLEGIRQ